MVRSWLRPPDPAQEERLVLLDLLWATFRENHGADLRTLKLRVERDEEAREVQLLGILHDLESVLRLALQVAVDAEESLASPLRQLSAILVEGARKAIDACGGHLPVEGDFLDDDVDAKKNGLRKIGVAGRLNECLKARNRLTLHTQHLTRTPYHSTPKAAHRTLIAPPGAVIT